MGTKKKKVVNNRGFSTVSVAKKEVIEVVGEVVEIVEEKVEDEVVMEMSAEMSASVKERDELQSLMDKVRSSCDKEVSRITKVSEFN